MPTDNAAWGIYWALLAAIQLALYKYTGYLWFALAASGFAVAGIVKSIKYLRDQS